MLKVLAIGSAIIVIVLVIGRMNYHPDKAFDARFDAARDGCAKWIGKEYGNGQPAIMQDAWSKNRRLVFQMSVPDTATKSTLYLCVVDTERGTMIKPSAFDQSWNR